MGSIKDWPDPPLWKTFNPDAQQEPVPSPRNSTVSLPALRPPVQPLPRAPTQPRAPMSKTARRNPPGTHFNAMPVAIAHLEKLNMGRNSPHPDNPTLSTSSLSEATASEAGNRKSLDTLLRERNRSLTSIDASQLVVDFDDPQQRLGVGSVGSVHFGHYFGEPVAVKRVRIPPAPRQLRSDPGVRARRQEQLRRFARQIRKYETVQHPSIVRFLGVCLPNDFEQSSALLVTELMYGGSLAESMNALKRTGKVIDGVSMARIAVQVCGAIRALHQDGFTWGDIKPENVLLTERLDPNTGRLPTNARACVSDMGLSVNVSEHLLTNSIGTSTVSQPSSFVYKAPEALEDMPAESLEVSKAGDIYALASLIYQMATSRAPWENFPMGFVFKAVVCEKKRPVWPKETDPDFRSDIPVELKHLVELCWAQEPKDRLSADVVFSRLVRIRNSLSDRSVSQINSTQQTDDSNMLVSSLEGSTCETRLVAKLSGRSSEASTAVPLPGEVPSPGALESPLNRSRDGQAGFVNSSERMDHGIIHVESSNLTPALTQQALNNINSAGSPLTSPEPRMGPMNGGAGSSNFTPESKPKRDSIPSTFPRSSIISPVTAPAPDPSAVNHPTGSNDDNLDEGEDAVRSIYKRSLNSTEFQLDDSQLGLRLEIPDQPVKNSGSQSALYNFSNEGVLPKKTNGSPLLDEDFAVLTAKAAVRIDRRSGADFPEVPSGSIGSNTNTTESSHNLTQTMADFNIFESVGPGASVATVAASLRRKRSSQIQAVLERAGAAFLELKRREELKNGTPPAQKRREAKNKAEEEAKKAAEDQAIAKLLKFRQEKNYSQLLEIMEEHPDFEALMKEGITAIEEAVSKKDLYLEVCEEGAVDRLLGSVSRYGEGNAEICKIFCRAISSLAKWRNESVDHRIRATGILSEIVTLMSHHQSNVSVLTAGCACLSDVARSSELSRTAVATLGGPLAVYRAMTRNLATYRDVELAKESLAAVQSIAQKNEAAAETLVQVAGLDAVSHSAEVFADEGLEENILSALESFSFYDDGRKALITSNGLRALSSLMLRKRDVAFSERCCVFIRSVAQWRDTKCETAMLESSIAERTVMTVRLSERFPGDEGGRLAFYASQAVMYLASFGHQTRERLRTTGALGVIVHLLRSRADNQRVVTMATNALVELMKGNKESQVEAERLGAVPLLLAAARTYHNEPSVFGAVSLTLGFFAGMREGKIPTSDPLHAFSKFSGRAGAGKLRMGRQKAPGGGDKKKFNGWKLG